MGEVGVGTGRRVLDESVCGTRVTLPHSKGRVRGRLECPLGRPRRKSDTTSDTEVGVRDEGDYVRR